MFNVPGSGSSYYGPTLRGFHALNSREVLHCDILHRDSPRPEHFVGRGWVAWGLDFVSCFGRFRLEASLSNVAQICERQQSFAYYVFSHESAGVVVASDAPVLRNPPREQDTTIGGEQLKHGSC